ncbi:MAG: hypothetical protein IKJ41_11780 [Clostridia bacterium]|nr:hypothetical protein [Clostridia bacterium]
MQEHNFDKILDFLCSGIMSKKERQNVRDELFDHLMCKYETNIAMGMDDELATENAIKDLGDRTVIKYRLSQVHSYYPNLSMKKAMNLLTLGFCLMSFQINIIINIINTGEITKFIGQIIMIVALFCLSKSNDKLKKAFVFGSAEFTLTKIAVAITPALPSVVFWIPHVLYIASCIANIVKWFYLFYGLRDLTAPFKEEYKKTIPYGFASFVNLLSPAYFIWLYSAMIVSENSIPDISEVATGAAYIIIPFALISIIITLVVFVMTSKCLWQNDHEYQIETSSKKKAIAAILAVAVAIVPMAAVDLWISYEKADTEVYTIHDSDISEDEYNRICGSLLSYGIPEKLVYSLPESEILKFEDSIPATDFEYPKTYDLVYSNSDFGRYGFEFDAYNCAIGLKNENGVIDSRFMVWIEYKEDIKGHYSDYIQIKPPMYNFILSNGTEKCSDTVLILSEENGKIMKNEPLETYYDDFFDDSVTGIRFQAKDGMLIYFGKNFIVDNSKTVTYQTVNLYHKIFPLTTMRNIPDEYKDDVLGLVSFSVHAQQWVDFDADWSEYNDTLELEETE